MFKTITGFIKAGWTVPLGWRMWAFLVTLVNLAIPFAFVARPEAQITLIMFFLSLVIGLVLFEEQGFTRLIGLMHFPWIFLVLYLIGMAGQTPVNNFFGIWVRTVIVLDAISLLIDSVNVYRYVSGERRSIIGL